MRKLIRLLVFVLMVECIKSKNIVNKDTMLKGENMIVRMGVRNLGMGIRPFVLKLDLMYKLKDRWNVGIFGYMCEKENPLFDLLKKEDKNVLYLESYPYMLRNLIQQKPYRQWGIGICGEYKIKELKRTYLSIQGGLSYVNGVVGDKILYQLHYSTYVQNYTYNFYNAVYYENIASDWFLRFGGKYPKAVQWSVCYYFSYIPTMFEAKTIFTGWLFELNWNFVFKLK